MERIKVRHPGTGRMMFFKLNFGTNLEEAVKSFGELSVFNRYLIGAKTSARNRIRKLMTVNGEEEIKEEMEKWSPRTPDEHSHAFSLNTLRKEFDESSEEKKEEIRGMLRKMMDEGGNPSEK